MTAKKTKTKSEKKTFVLLDAKNKDTNHVFASRQARASALKVAVSGVKDIKLRERGTQKVHHFSGTVKLVEVDPTKIPKWLVASLQSGNKLKKAFVKKLGTDYIK